VRSVLLAAVVEGNSLWVCLVSVSPVLKFAIMGGYISHKEDDYDSDDSSIYDGKIENPNELPRNRGQDHDKQCPPLSSESTDNICLDSATNDVDAAPATSTMSIKLTLDQVLSIEDQLDLYEKVSIVYLLYDDPKTALQELSSLIGGEQIKILYNWAIHQNLSGNKWQEKFVEAICIIQNYQVLKFLGFSRHDLRMRFLPHHQSTFLYVNKSRKALYFLCELFLPHEVDALVSLASSDMARKNVPFKRFNSYLELYFLDWEVSGYIKQNNWNNLYVILKQMEEFDRCDNLKEIVPVVPENQSPVRDQRIGVSRVKNKTVDASGSSGPSKKAVNVFEDILNSKSLLDMVSNESSISADNAVYISDENKYQIDPKNPGFCLIINQENFYTEIDEKLQHLLPSGGHKLEPRDGTQQDKEKLEETFKLFGFKTKTVDNLTHDQIIEKIDEVIRGIDKESSLFVCIMSHGNEGVVYGVNSCQVKITKIQDMLCSTKRTKLLGKPKVLILQSCQGTICQKLSPVEEDDDEIVTDGPSAFTHEAVFPLADLFTFWATVPGYGAIRHKKTGSWFIQSLCDKMIQLCNQYHFEDICTSVIGDVTRKTWRRDNFEVGMVPIKHSTLRKLLYLQPIRA
jgi:caspase 8